MTRLTNIQRVLALEAATAKAELDRLSPDELLAPAEVASREDAMLVKAALYLKHGFPDDCHKIAQSVATPNGSYWHGILHRREDDIGNSHYWYARVGPHPVLEAVGGYPKNPETEEREFHLLLEHTINAATKLS